MRWPRRPSQLNAMFSGLRDRDSGAQGRAGQLSLALAVVLAMVGCYTEDRRWAPVSAANGNSIALASCLMAYQSQTGRYPGTLAELAGRSDCNTPEGFLDNAETRYAYYRWVYSPSRERLAFKVRAWPVDSIASHNCTLEFSEAMLLTQTCPGRSSGPEVEKRHLQAVAGKG
jgi:hypothetical protein